MVVAVKPARGFELTLHLPESFRKQSREPAISGMVIIHPLMSSCRAAIRAALILKDPTLDVRTTTAQPTTSTVRRANLGKVVRNRYMPNNQYSPSRGQQAKYAPTMKRSSVCRHCRRQGERGGTSWSISLFGQDRIKESLDLRIPENR
jgi:hypothetical protein